MSYLEAVQRQLIFLGLDDSCPNSMLSEVAGGQSGPTPDQWKASVVSLIKVLLERKLIIALPGDGYEALTPQEIVDLLANGNPRLQLEPDLLWNCIWFEGTSELAVLLKSHGLLDWNALDQPVVRAVIDATVGEIGTGGIPSL